MGTSLRVSMGSKEVMPQPSGNRSESGVAAQDTLPSFNRTCRNLSRDPFEDLCLVLNSSTPVPLFRAVGG